MCCLAYTPGAVKAGIKGPFPEFNTCTVRVEQETKADFVARNKPLQKKSLAAESK